LQIRIKPFLFDPSRTFTGALCGHALVMVNFLYGLRNVLCSDTTPRSKHPSLVRRRLKTIRWNDPAKT
jgi:hypothetical protein